MKRIKIVFVIIATIIGAGFASGKEIYSFLFIYGKLGILGICTSSAILSSVVYKVYKICNKNNINSYEEFCNLISGNLQFSSLLNNMVNIFLLITFFVMIAGFSSFLKQEFNINSIYGSILVTSLCFCVFLRDIKGLMQISNFLIPVLIVFIVSVSAKDINIASYFSNATTENFNVIYIIKAISNSILYASYNCIILISVLIPIRKQIKKSSDILVISLLTFVTLILLSYSVYNLLSRGNSYIYQLEMPIIAIVEKYGTLYRNVYCIIIGIAIFTTAISSGCGFLNNFSRDGGKDSKKLKRNAFLICLLAIPFSQVSFSTLINLLYPVLGIFGLLEIILIKKRYKNYVTS